MSVSGVRRLDTAADDFESQLQALLELPATTDDVAAIVADIIDRVRNEGDVAVIELTKRFDGLDVSHAAELEIHKDQLHAARSRLDPLVAEALKESIDRVRSYHLAQKQALGDQVDWSYEDELGNQLGQVVRGMERVGIYAPGGKACYPSTVIMTAIPAQVAEVGEIVLVVPSTGGKVSDVLLAAADMCEVNRVFTVGGAQAVAALAYGTETIPRVDKIVGPGNIFVATAKEQVFGQVGIDMIAGPSEVVIVADATANPEWLAMDLFAQAEHDELAQAILISTDMALLDKVDSLMKDGLKEMPRSEIIQRSITDRGGLIKAGSLEQAFTIANSIAPEHLELALDDARQYLDQVKFAGAIFLGHHSAEVVGDYTAGPSHVLPTGSSARFASPLGVYDFQVRSSVVECSARGTVKLSRAAAILAEQEGLIAHARSAKYRLQG
jgi:histidinol dehydrogenase